MADGDSKLILTDRPREFFLELLRSSISRQRAKINESTTKYLVDLMVGFLDQTELTERPLAFMLQDALAESGAMRAAKLRHLGDTSLFVSGFFPEWIDRQVVGSSYYISMGSRAYHALSCVRQASIFLELSARFQQLVELLNEVHEQTLLNTEAGTIVLYERVLQTGSMRTASLMKSKGLEAPTPIFPTKGRAS